ncbi:MAG: N-acetylneuraminate synthase [Alphaproteobacteria bacterium]|jgi:N-acetylneuraminate synthase|nr:N-acetylneuraminate synthase [Alphaproteobacteria bacterium]
MRNPYIIAELSGNHNGDINRAFKLMEIAKEAGVDAVKLQTYTADTITIDHDGPGFLVKDGLWDGYKLYDLYKEAHTPWEWHPALFAKGKELGITVFSTPFDETAVDFLETLEAPLYKIASFELVHHPLIKYIAKTGKPIIMSTGMASLDEIREAVHMAQSNGCSDLTLLHCVSAYPAAIEDCNLATMVDLKKQFPTVKIGLSDHTLGTTVAIAAVALGAEVLEKHVTLSRSDGGVDAAFSLEPHELKDLCETTRDAQLAIGEVNYDRSLAERQNMVYRRSIYAVKDIAVGEAFTKDNIRIIRPGYGLSPTVYYEILQKQSKNTYSYGMPLQEDL